VGSQKAAAKRHQRKETGGSQAAANAVAKQPERKKEDVSDVGTRVHECRGV